MASKYKDVKHLSKEIAFALEDHALISYNQQEITSNIIKHYVDEYIKETIKDFYA
jgi:hypothetical protein|tara:strand:+ start:6836 stop:7000 length:165 start_codon:yes stop_codon:yes gene_type:complete